MTLRVKYYSLTEGSGYGAAALSYMQAMIDDGVLLQWIPLVWTKLGFAPLTLFKPQHRPILRGVSERQDSLLDTTYQQIDYDHVVIHSMPELFPKLREEGKNNIGYTVWETDRLPDHWPVLIHSVESLMVPCEFNVGLFSLQDGPTVHRVPHMLSWQTYPQTALDCARESFRDHHQIASSTTVFVNLSAWSPRKALVETLEVYLDSFTSDDDVCFLIKTDALGQQFFPDGLVINKAAQEILQELSSRHAAPPRVILMDEYMPEQRLLSFFCASDCYFSLTHSEGWGLGLYSAAELGKSVIVTGWGGQLDFLPSSITYLVDYSLIPVPAIADWASYSSNQNWAQADLQHAKQRLHEVHNDIAASQERAKDLRSFVQKEFSTKSIVNKIRAVIDV